MHPTAKSRPGLAHLALALVSMAALIGGMPSTLTAAPAGFFPPTLIYSPPTGTPINLVGVTSTGSTGSAQINITPSSGSGSGATATAVVNCTITGNAAGAFSVTPISQSFMPTSPPGSLGLTCTSSGSPISATLLCSEVPGGGNPITRSWPLNCPAGTSPTPPNLSYQPVPGATVNFTAANLIIGNSVGAQIRATPSGGSGTGGLATTKLDSCTLSGETVPGTFAGFQNTVLTFVGATSSPQNLNLTALVRPSVVTATLVCAETQGIDGSVIPRSWTLSVAAGTQPSRLSLTKTASAAQVVTDSEFSYTIEATNSGSGSESGLIVLDDVPAVLTVISAAGAGWNCGVVGNAVDCRRSSLVPNSASSIEVVVRAPATPRSVSNTARLTSQASSTPIGATANVEVVARPPTNVDLSIDKRDSADPVLAAATFSYSLDVTNRGDHPASGVSISDPLPAGMTLLSASGAGWTCTGSTTVNCTLAGTLPPGALTSVTLQVRAPTQSGTISNRATVSSTEVDTNVANNADTETTVVNAEPPPPPPPPQADLAITGQALPASALTGQAVELQLQASNRGPDAATTTTVTGTLSAAFDLRSAAGSGWTCTIAAQQLTCTRPGMAANSSADIRVQTIIRPGATATADANFVIASPIADPLTSNNSTRVSVSYRSGGADVAIVKTDSADPVTAAAQYSYSLAVSNAGPEAAAGVRVTDALPAALTFVSASGSGFTCTRTGQNVSCDLATALAVGASASVTISVRAPTSGQTINNEGVVSTTSSDPNAANNRSTQSTRISDRTAQDLEQLLDDAAIDPASQAALPVVAAECAVATSALASTCRDIVAAADAGRTGEVTEALRAIAPDEVLAQTVVLREISATQFFNVDARLNELRRGGGGFSLSGLSVDYGGQSIPLALVGEALQTALGFGDDSGGLVSPWGFYVNGTLTSGDQNRSVEDGRVGVGYDSRGITAGVDYRLSSRAVVGGAIGYANFTSDVSGGSQLDAKSLMFTGYSSYYINERFYIDSRLTYGNVSLDQQRQISYQTGSTLVDAQAMGETDATQLTLASSIGYHLNYGAWSVTPNAGLRYTKNDVDAFDESGANAYNVGYDEQSFSTVQVAVGVQVARAVSLSRGVLMPSFDFSLNSENSDDPNARAHLLNGSTASTFILEEQNADSSYASAGLGFVYLMGNGRQAFVSYRQTFGNDTFDRGTLNLGGRFEF